MTPQDETIKQLLADRETMQAELASLRAELAAERSDRENRDDTQDKAIEAIAGNILAAHGKDGVKVNWPVFALELDVIAGQLANTQSTGVQYDVNLIVNGVLVVVPDILAQSPGDEE